MITPEMVATALEELAVERANSWRHRLTKKMTQLLAEQGLLTTTESDRIDQLIGEKYDAVLAEERKIVLTALKSAAGEATW